MNLLASLCGLVLCVFALANFIVSGLYKVVGVFGRKELSKERSEISKWMFASGVVTLIVSSIVGCIGGE